jgi:hypothetical protein
VYKVSQSLVLANAVVTSVALATFATFSFTLSVLDQVSSLVAVFDQYRIDEIEFWLFPHLSSNNAASGNPGLLATVVDYDDTNALTTFAQALDYTNCVTSSGLMGHYRRFRPHVATAAYSGAFTSFANEERKWLDAASPGIIHYGIKTASATTSSVETYDAIVRYHVSFRNVR